MTHRLLGIIWYVICYNLPGYWGGIYFIGVIVYMVYVSRNSTNENLLSGYNVSIKTT